MAKNMRVNGTNFEDLGFGFELPQSLMGTVGAVRVMRVEYDHYSKMCRSNKIPPRYVLCNNDAEDLIFRQEMLFGDRAEKDIPSYIDLVEEKLQTIETRIAEKLEEQRLQQELLEAQQRAAEEAEKERLRLAKLERKSKAAAAGGAATKPSAGGGR